MKNRDKRKNGRQSNDGVKEELFKSLINGDIEFQLG